MSQSPRGIRQVFLFVGRGCSWPSPLCMYGDGFPVYHKHEAYDLIPAVDTTTNATARNKKKGVSHNVWVGQELFGVMPSSLWSRRFSHDRTGSLPPFRASSLPPSLSLSCFFFSPSHTLLSSQRHPTRSQSVAMAGGPRQSQGRWQVVGRNPNLSAGGGSEVV